MADSNRNEKKRVISKSAKKAGVSRRASVENDKTRFHIMWGITGICFFALFAKAFWLQVVNQSFYAEKATGAIVSTRTIKPNRGVIYDRYGTPLALSTPMKKISFNAREYAAEKQKWEKERKSRIEYLKKLPPERQQKIQEKIKKTDARFDLESLALSTGQDIEKFQKLLAKKRTHRKKDGKKIAIPLAEQLPKSQYAILKKNLPPNTAQVILDKHFFGVHAETEYKRYYPQPQPNAQLLGYMGKTFHTKEINGKKVSSESYQGKAGLELMFNKELAGTPGKTSMVRGAKGFGVIEEALLEAEVNGENLTTSIDARLQYILYRELEKAGRTYSARSASGIVIDARTGEVLAMSNWPAFNSNNLNERNNDNERNRVLIDAFEPGSVVKPLTVVAALESGKFHKNSVINTGGRIQIGKKVFTDHGLGPQVSLTTLIQRSSNLASIKIGQTLPREGIAKMFQKLSLGKKTGLNFPSEVAGNVKAPSKRQKLKRANMTFGYAIETNLAQIARAYSVIAANGVLRPLSFKKLDTVPDGEQVISPETAHDVLEMMKSVTVYPGTGTKAKIPGYTVGGKTGTAKKLRTDGQPGYYDDKYRALFVGVAPISNPHFVTAIVVEDPVDQFYGGTVAAPVFKNVTQEALRLNNVPMDKKL